MAFMGLSGEALATARILMILVPSFLMFGFNQSNLGGCLSYPSFIKHFPTIDTANTTGSTQAYNATIQGRSLRERVREKEVERETEREIERERE